jgi:hypothetical protein
MENLDLDNWFFFDDQIGAVYQKILKFFSLVKLKALLLSKMRNMSTLDWSSFCGSSGITIQGLRVDILFSNVLEPGMIHQARQT